MKYLLFILLLGYSQLLFSDTGGWVTRDGKPVPNSDAMKSMNGFGGWLVVTSDADWEDKWDTSPETTPHITEADNVTYGEQLTILPFYINPKPDDSGAIHLLCDIKVIRPDGSVSISQKDIECAKGKLNGKPRNVRIVSSIIRYTAEDDDQPGTWQIEYSITDKNRNTMIPLKTSFNLVEGSDADTINTSQIMTGDQFNAFMHTFYLNPKPRLIDSAMEFISTSDIAEEPDAQALLLMSFSCMFYLYDVSERAKWANTIDKLEDPAKKLLASAMSQTPEQIISATKVSPAKNDMNWACLFATGNIEYLNAVIEVLKYYDERDDINLFLTAASAKWSLSSNAKIHELVRNRLETLANNDKSELRIMAEDILNKSPQEIKADAIKVVRAQREKGVW